MKSVLEIRKERMRLENEARSLLLMEESMCRCHDFRYSDILIKGIEKLINEVEEEQYICKVITKCFKYKTDNFNSVNNVDIEIEYFVVMKKNLYNIFSKFIFNDAEEFENTLFNFMREEPQICCTPKDFYRGIFDDKFPYLDEFFNLLAETRYENKEAKLNYNDIDNCVNHMLSKIGKVKIMSK